MNVQSPREKKIKLTADKITNPAMDPASSACSGTNLAIISTGTRTPLSSAFTHNTFKKKRKKKHHEF